MPSSQHILFMCNLNAIRSPMAEAIVNARFGHHAVARSCGVWEGGYLDSFMVDVLREIGVDMSGHEPRTLADIDDAEAGRLTHVIALSEESAEKVQAFCALHPHLEFEQWTLHDPSQEAFSREDRLYAFRTLRDQLLRLMKDRFEEETP